MCVAMPGAQWWCKCVWLCLMLSGGASVCGYAWCSAVVQVCVAMPGAQRWFKCVCVDMPGAQWWCKCVWLCLVLSGGASVCGYAWCSAVVQVCVCGYAWCSVVVQVCVAMPHAQWWCKCVWICLVLSGGASVCGYAWCSVVALRHCRVVLLLHGGDSHEVWINQHQETFTVLLRG